MRVALLILVSLTGLYFPVLADDAPWQKANKEFAAGDFNAAVADYEAEVGAGRWSSNLFYNLANAYFRRGELGRAVLNYQRALELDPRHPEAEANLQLAREQAHSLEWKTGFWERYFLGDVLAIVAATSFWLALILLSLRARGIFVGLAALGMVVSAGCIFACYLQENGIRGRNAAVITQGEVEARVATADSARAVLTLTPGTEVLLLQQRGEWDYAQLPTGDRGWIPASAAERIRL